MVIVEILRNYIDKSLIPLIETFIQKVFRGILIISLENAPLFREFGVILSFIVPLRSSMKETSSFG